MMHYLRSGFASVNACLHTARLARIIQKTAFALEISSFYGLRLEITS
jgi:hypothetical protein